MNRQLFNAIMAQYGIENISGSDVVAWSSGVPCNVQSMKFYGKCEQSTTPTPDAPVDIKCNGGSYRYTSTGDSFDITVPELRGVGEYKDEWDYATGKGIRRIGERVLKGTEGWIKYHWKDGEGFYSYRMEIKSFNTSGEKCICTHYAPLSGYASLYYGSVEGAYVGTVTDDKSWLVIGNSFPTVSEFKAFLAEQYANGTPVTVYYAMAEPQEFYEAGGSLSNLSGRIEPKDVPVKGVDLKAKCVNHSIFSGEKKIVTVSGTDYVEWSGGEMHRNLPSLKFYGGVKRSSSTFSYDNPCSLYSNDGMYQIYSPIGVPLLVMSPPELRRVGIYKDEWDYCTGKSKRYIQEVVFDGTGERGEKITNSVVKRNDSLCYVTYTLQHSLAKTGIDALASTHFKSQWVASDGNIYSNDRTNLFLFNKNLNTTDEWNAWLQSEYESGHPVTIWYATAEPIEEFEAGGTLLNDSGRVEILDGTSTNHPLETTYITHS